LSGWRSIIPKTKYQIAFWLIVAAVCLGGTGYNLADSTQQETGPLLINEVMASNGAGLTDEDGDYSDWIELYNSGNQALNLGGWSLTDEAEQPEKWRFPDMTLGARQYLVIFASGKDRRSGPALHTNFRLNSEGEFLGLYRVLDQAFEDVLSPQFPGQFQDMTYGRYGPHLDFGYLSQPTPVGSNAQPLAEGRVEPVHFSVERGFYEQPFTVELNTTTPGAVVYYTVDGSEPVEAGGRPYNGPIRVEGQTLLRAAAFKPNYLPSPVATHTYLFMEDILVQPANPPGFPETWGTHAEDFRENIQGQPVIADYEMDPDFVNDPQYRAMLKEGLKAIPSLSLVTDMKNLDIYAHPRDIGPQWERPVSVELIYPDDRPELQINAGVRIHGGMGRREWLPKHSFRLFFRSEYGPTQLKYPLFPDSPVTEFDTLVLRAGADESFVGPTSVRKTTYLRDEWLRRSQIALSGVSPHGIFVHLYLNGLYWGLYNLIERPDAAFMSAYFGGDKEDWISVNHDGPISGPEEQLDALVEQFVRLNQDDLKLDNYKQYLSKIETLIDPVQFSDFIILNWYAGNEDWSNNNWYMGGRPPQDLFRYFSWDGELIFGEDGANIYLGKNSSVRANPVRPILQIWMHNPDFKLLLADRMYKHLFHDGALTDTNARARWLELSRMLEPAIIGESARWGDVRYPGEGITPEDWRQANARVLAQMEGNVEHLVRIAREEGYYPLIDPPTFSQHGGSIEKGFILSLASTGGTAYYTVDGSDPRLAGSEAVSPQAIAYSGPVVLAETTHLKARLQAYGVWSALNEATFTVVEGESQVRITEIMYNPLGDNDYEFIELKNIGQAEVELANLSFEGIEFTFPPDTPPLPANAFIVLANNAGAFAERYPDAPLAGIYGGRLSNSGEHLALKDVDGQTITTVTYKTEGDWPLSPDGRGDSLVLVNLRGDPNNPKSWRASSRLHGSPGEDDLELAKIR
jgi:hypothetical protein